MRYEVVREIFNSCKNNQMRDVFFDEVETDDPLLHVQNIFEGKRAEIESSRSGEDIFVDVNCEGLRQRYTFSPI